MEERETDEGGADSAGRYPGVATLGVAIQPRNSKSWEPVMGTRLDIIGWICPRCGKIVYHRLHRGICSCGLQVRETMPPEPNQPRNTKRQRRGASIHRS